MKADYDVVVLGGGAAGLMCALTAGKRGRRVLVMEKSNKLGKKILMSGGGRCNFTNLDIQPEHFICPNPHFVKSALHQYTQWDFIQLVDEHDIPYQEKKHGQLFCQRSAKDILNMLVHECEQAGVDVVLETEPSTISYHDNGRYHIETTNQNLKVYADSLVLATGGLSIPSLGGSGFAYHHAKNCGMVVNPTEASLVPFTLTGRWQDVSQALSGVSLPVVASLPTQSFTEDMLFTHRGLSGPAILQISNYWHNGDELMIDLLPDVDFGLELNSIKQTKPNYALSKVFTDHLPKSVALQFLHTLWPQCADKLLHDIKNAQLNDIGHSINEWTLTPAGTEGYRTAEVTRGGISVDEVSSKTMRAHLKNENLYIVGEALDVTGHLGGYNFQWAWSSGYVAGQNV